ncbi:MAG: hypothetical protein JSV01_02315, partial [Desulfobacterales bacterium]
IVNHDTLCFFFNKYGIGGGAVLGAEADKWIRDELDLRLMPVRNSQGKDRRRGSKDHQKT